MKILLTKTLPTEEGMYYRVCQKGDLRTLEMMEFESGAVTDGIEYWPPEELGGYWAKVEQSMFQLCESEQERREIIQKQHSNDTHRAVDIDRPEPECKCKDCNLIKMDSDKNKNKSMCLNCFKWSKKDA